MEPLLTFLRNTGAMAPEEEMLSRTTVHKHITAYAKQHDLQVSSKSTSRN
jgi:hypothetical protein